MYYQDKYLQLIVEVLSEAERIVMLKEAVPYPVVRKYLKIERDPTAEQRLTKIFNNLKAQPGSIQLDKKGDRIAFPYNPKGESSNPTEKEINDYIKKYQFTVKDYTKGLAFDEKNQRDAKLGKVLTLVAKKEKEDFSKKKGQDLLNKFNTDPKRTQASKDKSFLIVFAKHKYDIASMSTNRPSWRSCMNILSVGKHTHYLESDIKEGTFVAYIIESTDTNIEKPLGRISIKPYIKIDKDIEVSDSIESGDEVVNYAEKKTYGNIPGGEKEFIDFVDDMMEKAQKVSGEYRRSGCLYPDSNRNEFTDRATNIKKAEAAIEKGEKLPEKIFKNIGREYKEKYINSRLNNGDMLSQNEFEFATDEQKKKSIDNQIEKGYSLSQNEFEFATDEQKKKYVEYKVKMGHSLYNWEFEFATDEQKKKVIYNKFNKGDNLSEKEFEFATDEQKKKIIYNKFKKGDNLSQKEFEFVTDEQKNLYIDNLLKRNKILEPYEFKAATKKQKEAHIDIKLNIDGHPGYLKNYELEAATDKQRDKFINTLIEKRGWLDDYELKVATDEQKKRYIDIKLKDGYTLSIKEFKMATDEQKKKSIDIKIKEGTYISEEEFKFAPDEQKGKYIDRQLGIGRNLEDYELEVATDEQKESNALLIIQYRDLNQEEFKNSSDYAREKYIQRKIEKEEKLKPYELEAATKKQKERYINNRIKSYLELEPHELKAATRMQKIKAKLRDLFEEYERE